MKLLTQKRQFWQKVLLSVLAVLIPIYPPEMTACPAYVKGEGLPVFGQLPRNELHLFVREGVGGSTWREIPLQIDPLDRDGDFIFFATPEWRKETLKRYDRMTFHPEDFTEFPAAAGYWPCPTQDVYQFTRPGTSHRAYLMRCTGPIRADIAKVAPGYTEVDYRENDHTLSTGVFDYEFHKRNHMLFEHIDFPGFGPIANEADLSIRSDIRKFFTLNFDPSDVESYIEEYRRGPLGIVARVSFYLKILFFKIKLSLMTDVTFFRDSAHIPMFISLPRSGRTSLHPGSGMMYSWHFTQPPAPGAETVRMPAINPAAVRGGYEAIAPLASPYCEKEVCNFGYQVAIRDRELAMDFTMKKSLVDSGLVPLFMANVPQARADLDWKKDKHNDAAARRGIYLETSGLEDGEYSFDLWLKLGRKNAAASTCPQTVDVTKIL